MVLFFFELSEVLGTRKERERESDRNISILSCSLENIDCSRRPSRSGFAKRNARTRRRTPDFATLVGGVRGKRKEVEHGG